MQLEQTKLPDAKYGDPGDITRHDHRVTDYVDRRAD